MSERLYEVEIKSKALLREGKNGLITYFEGGRKKTIVRNVQRLYPQYTDPADSPIVNITPITREEYERRFDGGQLTQKQHLIKAKAFVVKPEDIDETVGN